MAVKKRVVHHKPAEPEVEPTEESAEAEAPVSPMQVVEVVEEGAPAAPAVTPESAVSVAPPASNAAPAVAPTAPGATPITPTLEESKRREIEELFQPSVATPQIMPEISVHKRGPSKALLIGLAAALLAIIFIGGGLLVVTQGSVKLPFIKAKPTPTPTQAPTPTPTVATANRADLTIQVLNGGGTPGAAGKMKGFLEGKGYKVLSTGNTEEYTYEKTEIWVKASKANYLPLLQEDLKGEYTIGTASATLSDSAPADARIIVGKK